MKLIYAKSIEEYLTIVIEEILLNGCHAFIDQEIENRFFHIEVNSCKYKSKEYIKFKIFSNGTINYSPNTLGAKPAPSFRNENQTGVGLFLINKLLKNLGSHCFDEIERTYFQIDEELNGQPGFTITFTLPK